MGLLSRRKADLVEARRVQPPPAPTAPPVRIDIPSGVNASVGPAAAAPQTVFYVNIPNPTAHPQPAPPPPPHPPQLQPIHYQTIVQHITGLRRRRRAFNLLGIMAALLGTFALVANYVPSLAPATLPTGVVGLAIGAFALVTAILFGRSSRSQALAGVFLSGLAVTLRMHDTGQLKPELQQYQKNLPQMTLPAGTLPGVNLSTIESKLGLDKTDAATTAKEAADTARADAAKAKAAALAQAQAFAKARVDAAHARLDSARAAAANQADADPAVVAARSAVNAAEADLTTARTTYGPGSPQVTAASTRWLDAKAKLQQTRQPLIDADPAVRAADQIWRDEAAKKVTVP